MSSGDNHEAAALDGPLARFQVGAVFHGRYELVRCIRSGGMGAVYEVLDQKTRRRRAMKVMLPSVAASADFRARFQRESTVTAEIESDHIVETFDADVDEATAVPFLVMELLKGDDLGRVLEHRGALAPVEAIELLRQAALGLDKTHQAGIVHRDLKPENLFLTRSDDGQPRVKILDFGIAKVVESDRDARLTRAVGTPLYMAPEQIKGEGNISSRADLFALGHIAYALLTGEPYWAEDSWEAPAAFQLFSRMILGPKEAPVARALRRRNVALPPGFDVWFYRATAANALQRYESATSMVKELKRIFGLGSDAFGDLSSLAEPSHGNSAPPPGLGPPPFTSQGGVNAVSRVTPLSGPQGTAVLESLDTSSPRPLLGTQTTARPFVIGQPDP
jgi:serine/threonine-protein kinase